MSDTTPNSPSDITIERIWREAIAQYQSHDWWVVYLHCPHVKKLKRWEDEDGNGPMCCGECPPVREAMARRDAKMRLVQSEAPDV
jgi:hypothetical protein